MQFSFSTKIWKEKVIFSLCLIVENINLICSKMCFILIFDSIEQKNKNFIYRNINIIIIEETRLDILYISMYLGFMMFILCYWWLQLAKSNVVDKICWKTACNLRLDYHLFKTVKEFVKLHEKINVWMSK